MTAVSMSSYLALYGEKISVLDFDHQGHAPKGCFDRSKYPLSMTDTIQLVINGTGIEKI